MRLLGTLRKTYGKSVAFTPPPVYPPLAQVCESHAVSVPSRFAPTLIFAKIDGRLPAICNSLARSRNSFTGFPPLSFDSRAHSTPHRSDGNLLPKPPPI